MKKTLLIILTLLPLLALTACNGSSQQHAQDAGGSESDNSRAAVIEALEGTVTANSDGVDMSAFKGLALLRRDSLSTAAESWTCLELGEEKYVLIEENSSFLIANLSDDARSAELTLSSGKMWVVAGPNLFGEDGFVVRTPTCALSVRGTVFFISCDRDGGSRIAVFEGLVNAVINGESYELSVGTLQTIVENDLVWDVFLSGLTEEDIAPFRSGAGAGPGGVYEYMRSLLPDDILQMADLEELAESMLSLTRLSDTMTIEGVIIDNLMEYRHEYANLARAAQSDGRENVVVQIEPYGVKFDEGIILEMAPGVMIREAALGYSPYFDALTIEPYVGEFVTVTGYFTALYYDEEVWGPLTVPDPDGNEHTYYAFFPNGGYRFNVTDIQIRPG